MHAESGFDAEVRSGELESESESESEDEDEGEDEGESASCSFVGVARGVGAERTGTPRASKTCDLILRLCTAPLAPNERCAADGGRQKDDGLDNDEGALVRTSAAIAAGRFLARLERRVGLGLA